MSDFRPSERKSLGTFLSRICHFLRMFITGAENPTVSSARARKGGAPTFLSLARHEAQRFEKRDEERIKGRRLPRSTLLNRTGCIGAEFRVRAARAGLVC